MRVPPVVVWPSGGGVGPARDCGVWHLRSLRLGPCSDVLVAHPSLPRPLREVSGWGRVVPTGIMSGYRDWGGPSEEHQPVTYWGGHPIYACHLIAIVYCVLMILTAVLGPAIQPVLDVLIFRSDRVLSGQVWRIATYGLFNIPSLRFALDMLLLIWFGRELERHFGRRIFLWLYAGIYCVPSLVFTLVGFAVPTLLVGEPGALALFVAFATQFPGMPVFFSLLAKWAALILVGIFSLMAVAARSWTELILIATTCGYAHGFIRYQQGELTLPSIRLWKRTPSIRLLPDEPASGSVRRSAAARPTSNLAELDALLDKIGRSGIGSLTEAERARLESARRDLMRRGDRQS